MADDALTRWRRLAEAELKDRSLDDLTVTTPEGIEVRPLYTAEDLEGLEATGSLPGMAPFHRGVRATKNANRPWNVRKYPGN